MNSSIALRLLWKEYRMQRGLWLAMAVGCLFIQGIIAFVMYRRPEAFQGGMTVALLLTFFYTIGSGAITFAIEREEGTQIRPVMLGGRAGLTLSIKLLFGVVATVVLLATMICSCLLLSQRSFRVPPGLMSMLLPPDRHELLLPVVVLMVVITYLAALLWSMLFSLLTRTVILALGLAVMAMLASSAVVGAALSVTSLGQSEPPTAVDAMFAALVPSGLVLSLLVATYLLTHRWVNHVFDERPAVRSPPLFRRFRFSRSALDGGVTVQIGGEDRTAFEVMHPDIAVIQPPPRIGLSLLYSFWGSNRWRHLRFLRWKEALETRKVFLLFLIAAVMLAVVWVRGFRQPGEVREMITILALGACLCCGLMAFRKEQDDQRYCKLAEMGLSPQAVWFSKHLVWLFRAVACCLVGLTIVWLIPVVYGVAASDRWLFDDRWFGANRGSGDSPALVSFVRSGILVLAFYAIGQASSQLIRSAIVSIFVGFVVVFIIWGWAFVCGWLGVPWTLSVLPIALGGLLVTWLRTRYWMLEDQRPRTWLLPVASIMGAIIFAYAGTGLFRVYQVPWVEPVFATTADVRDSHGSVVKEFSDGLSSEQRVWLLSPVSADEERTFRSYQQAAQLLRNGSAEEKLTAREIIFQTSTFAECAEFSPGGADVVVVEDSTAARMFVSLVDDALSAAQDELMSGRTAKTLDRYRSAFAICQHATGRGEPVDFWNSHELTKKTLAALQKWAQHKSVTAELVDRATDLIDQHRVAMIPLEVVNAASAAIARNSLNGGLSTLTQLGGTSDNGFALVAAMQFPGERARCNRLLNQVEHFNAAMTASYRRELSAAENDSGGETTNHMDQFGPLSSRPVHSGAVELGQTSPAMSLLAPHDVTALCRHDIATECEVRATKIMLQLLLQRRESNTLPASLDGFDVSLSDPWNNQPFRWYPQGLEGDLLHQGTVLVSAGTPFLMSTQNRHVTMQPQWWPTVESEAFTRQQAADNLGGLSPEVAAEEEALMRKVFQMNAVMRNDGTSDVSIWMLPVEQTQAE